MSINLSTVFKIEKNNQSETAEARRPSSLIDVILHCGDAAICGESIAQFKPREKNQHRTDIPRPRMLDDLKNRHAPCPA
jgi:hypothetical protein